MRLLANRLVLPALAVAAFALPAVAQFTTYCPGDGSVLPCPCGNDGLAPRGCANSAFASGALLTGSGGGTVGASFDDVVLTASSMTGSTCVFFQGDAEMPPVIVDDGIGCVTGNVLRLGVRPVVGGSATFPGQFGLHVSVVGQVPSFGGLRYYQCYYRNADASFCPPALSNRTNGLIVAWHGPA